MLSYGVRSGCCYAPIKSGKKKTKTGRVVQIWICCKCKARDVDLVNYTGSEGVETSRKKKNSSKFIEPDPENLNTEI